MAQRTNNNTLRSKVIFFTILTSSRYMLFATAQPPHYESFIPYRKGVSYVELQERHRRHHYDVSVPCPSALTHRYRCCAIHLIFFNNGE